jgi:hypothetical protein
MQSGQTEARGSFARSLRRAVFPGAIALAAALACVGPAAVESASTQSATTNRSSLATSALPHNRATLDFIQFALNALLVPVLDDDSPARWADPSLSFDCDAGSVTVDGAPLDVGAPVPAGAFTLRWHMQRCTPLDDYTELSGDVELMVETDGTTYRAHLRPGPLRVVSSYGEDVLTESFTASMTVGR